MQLNGVTLTDRFNRPGVGEKVAIRTLFINNGDFIAPYDVSACTIFTKLVNASPASIVDADDGLISSDATSVVLMNFGVSGGVPTGGAADPHDGIDDRVTSQRMVTPTQPTTFPLWNVGYDPGTQASGIFRVGTGEYIAILDGQNNISGNYSFHGSGLKLANTASSVGNYIDVWTVKFAAGSTYQSIINNFSLYKDKFFAITEPLLLKTTNKLQNKKIVFGSKVDLKYRPKCL